ncbi:MAG: GNAT family N-acetyltransferase [Bdellovibrionales bacterium]|nr:GNAT family N-acetyltransferase [Bdellovibrionales bacterium]
MANADYGFFKELFEELDNYHSTSLPTIFKKPLVTFRSLEQFEGILANDSNILLCAEDEQGNISGIIQLIIYDIPESIIRISSKNMKIDNLIVSPKTRRLGVGKMLVNEALEEAKRQKVDNIVLDVFSFNHSAIEFYKNIGFIHQVERLSLSLSNH